MNATFNHQLYHLHTHTTGLLSANNYISYTHTTGLSYHVHWSVKHCVRCGQGKQQYKGICAEPLLLRQLLWSGGKALAWKEERLRFDTPLTLLSLQQFQLMDFGSECLLSLQQI